MTSETRIQELVERALDLGCTPEEVCKESPELLEGVRSLWSRTQAVRDQVAVLFPSGGSAQHGSDKPSSPDEGMPQVPGHEVRTVIGRGGAGVVYRARQLKLNRDVAIKMLLAGEYASQSELARFMLEAEAEASLRHPNIVQVHDVGECEGRPYFTMEFVEGGNLSERLAGTPQPAARAASLLTTLTEAVHVAHEGGIVHRDLKPSNVLLTSDGTPKISDFGLARRIERGSSITASGLVLGTPSYMAPEQVQGPANSIGPAVDIYALGSILYEMLTGRPPFRAESALATQLQVVSQDPVPPSRLNGEVPRDLETICMKCLQKDPRRRYASAAALADDLRRFLRREPIAARRTGPLERTLKWVRRRPAQAAVLAGGVLTLLTLVGAGVWLGLRRATVERTVDEDLQEVARREHSADWPQARTTLERAKVRLGDGGPADLRNRLAAAGRELDLVARLDAIRLDRAAADEGAADIRFDTVEADRQYTAAFQAAQMGTLEEDPEVVASRIRASNIQGAVVAALDDWAEFAAEVNEPRRQAWLLEVARRADPDPTGWRDRARNPSTWGDASALAELAGSAVVSEASIPLLVAIGERLTAKGGNSVGFLRRVQEECPQDFWANFALGNAFTDVAPEQAVEYFRAALALRPKAVAAYFNLGGALRAARRFDESIECFQRLLRTLPNSAMAHNSLGRTLEDAGKLDDAAEEFRLAIKLDPEWGRPHGNLGRLLHQRGESEQAFGELERGVQLAPEDYWNRGGLGRALLQGGRLDEAIAQYREAVRIKPTGVLGHNDLGYALYAKGQLDEAIEQCELALRLDPKEAKAHLNLGLALQAKDSLDLAIAHFRQAMLLDPQDPKAPNNLGRAFGAQGRHAEAVQSYRRAIALDPTLATAHSNLGTELVGMGESETALSEFQLAAQLEPTLVSAHANLASVLIECGRLKDAQIAIRRWLELAPEGAPLHSAALEKSQSCERLLALDSRLPAILQGLEQPADGAECLQLAELCRARKQYATALRFSSDALERSPALAKDPRSFARYNASCCAALAGCAQSKDALDASDEQRAAWRGQAREWLRADLDSGVSLLQSGPPALRAFLKQSLPHWLDDPDLSGVRDDDGLKRLPPAEQEEWRGFWSEVNQVTAGLRPGK